ncbi:hypothetical protein DM01DRAFT_1136833 [Hesseltinella vesiculosa]|uniref:Pleckstrin homology domain-containing protein n=1 Tax=Hesseltinella vesiculosa TaxID=101127 RepID=A0A1X2G8F5_9FUNG|nr:hypothetical protein DM01DRAFT_1136833 [Hesseltinella vesiculosa]
MINEDNKSGSARDSLRSNADMNRLSSQNGARKSQLLLANDLAQGLLQEVRRLQAALQEKEQSLREMQVLMSDLEKEKETTLKHIRQRDSNEEKLKGENWDLEVSNQDLQTNLNHVNQTLDKLHLEHSRLIKQLDDTAEQLEILRAEHEKVKSSMDAMKVRHEHDQQAHRRNQGSLHREIVQLKKNLDDLQVELKIARAKLAIKTTVDNHHQQLPAPSAGPTDNGPMIESTEDLHDHELTLETVPRLSPMGSATNLATTEAPSASSQQFEVDTLKQSLAHAHRMVSQLRSNVHKEKTERLELKKLLNEAQETIEMLEHDNLDPHYQQASTSTGGKGSLKKPVSRPNKVLVAKSRAGAPAKTKAVAASLDHDQVDDIAEDCLDDRPADPPLDEQGPGPVDMEDPANFGMSLEQELLGGHALSLDLELQQSGPVKSLSDELAFFQPKEDKPVYHDRGVNTDEFLLSTFQASMSLPALQDAAGSPSLEVIHASVDASSEPYLQYPTASAVQHTQISTGVSTDSASAPSIIQDPMTTVPVKERSLYTISEDMVTTPALSAPARSCHSLDAVHDDVRDAASPTYEPASSPATTLSSPATASSSTPSLASPSPVTPSLTSSPISSMSATSAPVASLSAISPAALASSLTEATSNDVVKGDHHARLSTSKPAPTAIEAPGLVPSATASDPRADLLISTLPNSGTTWTTAASQNRNDDTFTQTPAQLPMATADVMTEEFTEDGSIAQQLASMVTKEEALAWVKAGIAEALANERKEAAARRRRSESFYVTKAEAESMARQRVEEALVKAKEQQDTRTSYERRPSASSVTSAFVATTPSPLRVNATIEPTPSKTEPVPAHADPQQLMHEPSASAEQPLPPASYEQHPIQHPSHHIRMTGSPVQRTLSQLTGYRPKPVPTVVSQASHTSSSSPSPLPLPLPPMPTSTSVSATIPVLPQPSTSTASTSSTNSKSSMSSSASVSRLGILSGLVKLQPSTSTPTKPTQRSLRISTSNSSLRLSRKNSTSKHHPQPDGTPVPSTLQRQRSLMDRMPSTTSAASASLLRQKASFGNIKITEQSAYARTFVLPTSSTSTSMTSHLDGLQRERSLSQSSRVLGLSKLAEVDNPSNNIDLIMALTQTMIGEWVWKHTRRQLGGGISENKHKRFFWVHPYTRTLYWSATEPGVDSDETPSKRGKSPLK